MDQPEQDAFGCVIHDANDAEGKAEQILLAMTPVLSGYQAVSPVLSAATKTALYCWLIGILCMAFIVAGIVGPLQSMSQNLNQTTDRTQREDMLLTISDRDDELGQVANSLHEMEEERQGQISKLQLTERVARSSADLLTTVLDSMVEGVIAVDRESRIVFMNQGARQLLAVSQVIGAGHRLYEAVRVPAFLDAMSDALGTGEVQTLEYRPSREQIDLVLMAIPISSGPHAGAVAVVRDISETRRLEAMRRDFVSGVSHELKTPLTVIQACTDTLLNGALSDTDAALRFLKQIDEQSERLLQLILSMLQLARVESGQQVLHLENLDARRIADDIVGSFGAVADSRSVQLLIQGPEVMALHTDRPALRTILTNLIDNALKHTHAKGTVIVELSSDVNGDCICVRDTGIGIPEDLLGRIFERFYRVEKDRSRVRGGSGLGLAIVKHLCEAIGATISVRSELGRGSEFRIQFSPR
jgi:two-component system phosphate regulon sensor histidine kinase PhoR